MFMQIPSKIDYPDYYLVISEPIDMAMIEEKIKSNRVSSILLHILLKAVVSQLHQLLVPKVYDS